VFLGVLYLEFVLRPVPEVHASLGQLDVIQFVVFFVVSGLIHVPDSDETLVECTVFSWIIVHTQFDCYPFADAGCVHRSAPLQTIHRIEGLDDLAKTGRKFGIILVLGVLSLLAVWQFFEHKRKLDCKSVFYVLFFTHPYTGIFVF